MTSASNEGGNIIAGDEEEENDMKEDKQKICDELCRTLQLTRKQSDLISLTYSRDKQRDMEFVTVLWITGASRRINVSWDSGTAMIRDIMRTIG